MHRSFRSRAGPLLDLGLVMTLPMTALGSAPDAGQLKLTRVRAWTNEQLGS